MKQRTFIVIILGLVALSLTTGCSLRRRLGTSSSDNPTQAPAVVTVPTEIPTASSMPTAVPQMTSPTNTLTTAPQAAIPTATQAVKQSLPTSTSNDDPASDEIQKSLDDLMKSLNSTDTLKDIK